MSEENPSRKDVLATTYDLLGFDPATSLRDRLGRPLLIADEGQARRELLA